MPRAGAINRWPLPSYIVRQLYEMQTGARTGSGVMLMKAAVARLSPDEMIDVAAYLAS